jgi:hypothetical protein
MRRAAQAAAELGWRVWRLGGEEDSRTWAVEPSIPYLRHGREDPAMVTIKALSAGADGDPPSRLVTLPLYLPAPDGEQPKACWTRPLVRFTVPADDLSDLVPTKAAPSKPRR